MSFDQTEKRRAFGRRLGEFLNGGAFSKADKLSAGLLPGWVRMQNARRLCSEFKTLPALDSGADGVRTDFVVEPYGDAHPEVLGMSEYLVRHCREDLRAALVHGSLATGEGIPYSDFDALVVVGRRALEDAGRLEALAKRLSESRRFMFAADPLQHHGWFVITEPDLDAYDEGVFPTALFEYSRSLLGPGKTTLGIHIRRGRDALKGGFDSVSRSFRATLGSGSHRRNLYDLKNLLSTFMLLPALYLQARDGRGVYKKFSFELARSDFTVSEWRCMDEVSAIRTVWKDEVFGWRRRLLTSCHPWRKHFIRLGAPAVPEYLRQRLSDDLLARMNQLVQRMEEKLKLGKA